VGNPRSEDKKIPTLDSCWPILCIPVRESKEIQRVYQWRSPNESRIRCIQGVAMNTESGMNTATIRFFTLPLKNIP